MFKIEIQLCADDVMSMLSDDVGIWRKCGKKGNDREWRCQRFDWIYWIEDRYQVKEPERECGTFGDTIIHGERLRQNPADKYGDNSLTLET